MQGNCAAKILKFVLGSTETECRKMFVTVLKMKVCIKVLGYINKFDRIYAMKDLCSLEISELVKRFGMNLLRFHMFS